MEIIANTKIHFPRELVFRTYRDEIQETVPYLPTVASIEVRERHDDGPRTRMVNLWTAKTQIPSLAKKFIQGEMLSWTDRADWDQNQWQCRWSIETYAFPGMVECSGTTHFVEVGAETEIRINGSLVLHLEKAHIPKLLAGTVQPIIEKLVVEGLKPNLLSTGQGVEKLLTKKSSPKS
jgi:hypothetical protein